MSPGTAGQGSADAQASLVSVWTPAPTWQALRAHVRAGGHAADTRTHTHTWVRICARARARRPSCRSRRPGCRFPCWAGGGWPFEAPHPGRRREGTSPSHTSLPPFNHLQCRGSGGGLGLQRPSGGGPHWPGLCSAPTDPAVLKPKTRLGTTPAFCQGRACPAPFGEGFPFSLGWAWPKKGGGLVPLSGGSDTTQQVDR